MVTTATKIMMTKTTTTAMMIDVVASFAFNAALASVLLFAVVVAAIDGALVVGDSEGWAVGDAVVGD